MRALIGSLTLVFSLTASCGALASVSVESIRAWLAPDNTRLVFDLSAPASHSLFTLDNPSRVVIDVKGASLRAKLEQVDLKDGPVQRIRSGDRQGDLRIVLDLAERVQPSSFSLAPNDQYGHRLVVDLGRIGGKAAETVRPPLTLPDAQREVIVAIDAGHGGEDPGALGPGKLQEKKIVLSIAKLVHARLNAEPGFKAVLIRTGDYYVSLRERTARARQSNADLFVSIHADAAQDFRARGASVWVLSNRGATSEMGRWLAQKENSADLIGGAGGSVSLGDKDEDLATVLLDMSMESARRSSHQVAGQVHANISRFAKMHKGEVEKAGFVVLKSPDIPSILVETGFISNPTEARRLSQASYQQEMSKAVADGILNYFWTQPPPGTLIAKLKDQGQKSKTTTQSYKVLAGDTLSIIAQRKGVSLAALRSVNELSTDRIRVGQVLKIPAG